MVLSQISHGWPTLFLDPFQPFRREINCLAAGKVHIFLVARSSLFLSFPGFYRIDETEAREFNIVIYEKKREGTYHR